MAASRSASRRLGRWSPAGSKKPVTSNQIMVTFPPAKINLGLHILSKRPDGYHSISTCFYPLPWNDLLEVLPSARLEFVQTGIRIPGKAEDNLCLRAYHLLKKDLDLPPVKIHLHKIMPAGAGLGGGSSNAAHMLRALNTVFALKLSMEELMKYASELGSDCTFFLQDAPMLGAGRGEILEPIPVSLKGYYLEVRSPAIHVSTAEAYAGVVPRTPVSDLRSVIQKPITAWRAELKNDFEVTVFQKHPAIQTLKAQFYELGAVYASMSGSGSSVFGIFEKKIDPNGPLKALTGWSGWL